MLWKAHLEGRVYHKGLAAHLMRHARHKEGVARGEESDGQHAREQSVAVLGAEHGQQVLGRDLALPAAAQRLRDKRRQKSAVGGREP